MKADTAPGTDRRTRAATADAGALPLTRRGFLVAAAYALGTSLPGCTRHRPLVHPAQGRAGPVLPGYPPDARLLIINADDIGIARSVNAAVISAFERRLVVSGSAMVPCESFPEFASWARMHPNLDLGIHLTFTSLPSDRWRPILPAKQVQSLVDADGFFPVRWPLERVVVPDEIHAEIHAQVAHARELGIEPTHLDAHQHVLQLRGPEVFGALVRAARETRLPFRLARSWDQRAPYLLKNAEGATVPLERLIAMSSDSPPAATGWASWYADRIKEIPPGLSELFLHPGYDDAELRSLLPGDRPSGSVGRQRDYDALASDELLVAIRDSGVIRVTWREVGSAIANR